jgi:hypothetical protein
MNLDISQLSVTRVPHSDHINYFLAACVQVVALTT